MAIDLTPNIGDWYQGANGVSFEIVAVDNSKACVEVQYFDGTIEEIEMEHWNEQMFVAIAAPEDWSGSMDMEKEDYGVDTNEESHLHWDNPLNTFDY